MFDQNIVDIQLSGRGRDDDLASRPPTAVTLRNHNIWGFNKTPRWKNLAIGGVAARFSGVSLWQHPYILRCNICQYFAVQQHPSFPPIVSPTIIEVVRRAALQNLSSCTDHRRRVQSFRMEEKENKLTAYLSPLLPPSDPPTP